MDLTTLLLLAWMQICCREYQVDPAFAHAVAIIESGAKMGEVRTGVLGKKGTYAAPFGLHRAYCREKFGIDPVDPWSNIAIGVAALRGKDKRRVFKRYNKSFNEAYWREMNRAERQYRGMSNGTTRP